MPDSLLTANLEPVTWTNAATAREPRPEVREKKREPKRPGPALVRKSGEAAESEDTVDAAPHELDSFA